MQKKYREVRGPLHRQAHAMAQLAQWLIRHCRCVTLEISFLRVVVASRQPQDVCCAGASDGLPQSLSVNRVGYRLDVNVCY